MEIVGYLPLGVGDVRGDDEHRRLAPVYHGRPAGKRDLQYRWERTPLEFLREGDRASTLLGYLLLRGYREFVPRRLAVAPCLIL
jgi:hypothetical protein